MLKVLIPSLIVVVGAFIGGCSDEFSCEDFCKKASECPDAPEMTDDCGAYCEFAESSSEIMGCSNDFETLMACAGDNQDVICEEESEACDAEGEVYATCSRDYAANCDDNPTDCLELLEFMMDFCAEHPDFEVCADIPT